MEAEELYVNGGWHWEDVEGRANSWFKRSCWYVILDSIGPLLVQSSDAQDYFAWPVFKLIYGWTPSLYVLRPPDECPQAFPVFFFFTDSSSSVYCQLKSKNKRKKNGLGAQILILRHAVVGFQSTAVLSGCIHGILGSSPIWNQNLLLKVCVSNWSALAVIIFLVHCSHRHR